jgi:hypothetical protein
MSRISYSDDEDFPGQFFIWQANCDRSLRGRKGQAALRELEAALVAMPVKELHREVYVQASGEACALGALDVHRKVQGGLSRSEALAVCADRDPYDSQEHGQAMGLPRLVAWKVVEQNDIENDQTWDHVEGPSRYPGMYADGVRYRRDVTPVERYERMLAWVRSQLTEQP